MKLRYRLLIAFVILACRFSDVIACTVIVAGKQATADGSVLISHTDAGADSRIFRVPAKTYKPGEMAPVYWGIQDAERALNDDGKIIGFIPQVEKTYAYFQ